MREPDKSRKSPWWRVRAACTALGRDRDGSVFFYTTLALPVIVGFAVLAIDGSRLMNLHSHLQHAADGLALAAAGELDRRPDACIRAVRALENLVENEQRFGDAGAAIITMADVSYRFLDGLPATDDLPIDASYEVSDCEDEDDESNSEQEVRFIEVTVNPQTLTTLMPAAFIGASTTAAANATAVAGFKEAVCQFTPMMMCNPYEPLGKTIFEVAEEGLLHGKSIEIRRVGGPNSTYGPGNFGFLKSPAIGPDGKDVKIMEALATASPEACFFQEGVDTEPGQNAGPVADGLNVRFDIYPTGGNLKDAHLPKYRPSVNVRKGYGIEKMNDDICKKGTLLENAADDPPLFQGFPIDDGVTADLAFGRIGNGEWDFERYWAANFGHVGIPPHHHPVVPVNPDGVPPVHPVVEVGTTPVPWSNDDPPSRYEVYRYEIDNSTLISQLSRGNEFGGETGAPQCYEGDMDDVTDVIDRRILYVAIIECGVHTPTGRDTGVPVEAFAKFFLLRPLPKNSDSIYVEFIGLTEPGADEAVVRDVVQLYR